MNRLEAAPPSAELVVIGGGVVGRRHRVPRLAGRPAAAHRGGAPALCTLTTPVAAGAYRLQFEELEELELVRESVDLFAALRGATEQRDYDPGVREQGYLWLTTIGADRGRQRAWSSSLTVGTVGRRAAVRRRRRATVAVGRRPTCVQARFRAGDGFLDTKELTFGLAESSGAAIVRSTCRARGSTSSDGSTLTGVRTDRGTIACPAAVIAAGPLSRPVAALAGLTLPLVTVRRHKLILPDLPAVPPDGP